MSVPLTVDPEHVLSCFTFFHRETSWQEAGEQVADADGVDTYPDPSFEDKPDLDPTTE